MAGENQVTDAENINLVDLIEQPAWKTILIDLVKSEKMDPWAIDVIELADKYLQKINRLEHANLRIPANAILALAILLKLKARTIRLTPVEEIEEEITKGMSEEELRAFEDSIPEFRSGRQVRQGKVSLDELVSSIEDILDKTRTKQSILRNKEIPEFAVQLTEEDIDKKIEEIYARIQKHADSQGLLTFSQLLENKTPLEMVNVFIPMLFLINQGKINAWQEEWFGEIFISLLEREEEKNKEVEKKK